MKRSIWIGVLVIAVLSTAGCQGSGDVARAWSVRAEQGLINEQTNTEALIDTLGKATAAAREAEIAALMRGLQASVKDGKPDYTGYSSRLAGHITQRMADRDALSEARVTAARNREEIRKCLTGMIRAAEAWGEKDEVKSRLDRIEALVSSVLNKRSK